jgi:hypothetical protein
MDWFTFHLLPGTYSQESFMSLSALAGAGIHGGCPAMFVPAPIPNQTGS